MSSGRRLNVPLIAQREEFWCIPACIEMVLEYLNNSEMLSTPTPTFGLDELARILRTKDGTWAHDIPAINPRLEEAIPSVEFEDEYRLRMVEEIDVEVTNRRPCIAMLHLGDGKHRTWHAVVVTDIDIGANRIWYNDPGPPMQRTETLSAFQHFWNMAMTTLLKVQIGRNTRTVLTQFPVQP